MGWQRESYTARLRRDTSQGCVAGGCETQQARGLSQGSEDVRSEDTGRVRPGGWQGHCSLCRADSSGGPREH